MLLGKLPKRFQDQSTVFTLACIAPDELIVEFDFKSALKFEVVGAQTNIEHSIGREYTLKKLIVLCSVFYVYSSDFIAFKLT